jgi:hypothetical protein
VNSISSGLVSVTAWGSGAFESLQVLNKKKKEQDIMQIFKNPKETNKGKEIAFHEPD